MSSKHQGQIKIKFSKRHNKPQEGRKITERTEGKNKNKNKMVYLNLNISIISWNVHSPNKTNYKTKTGRMDILKT